ncbi:LOW QUALITY PROTEIN: uncharacterized protein LOC144599761 [Rhinoraja longicauda]
MTERRTMAYQPMFAFTSFACMFMACAPGLISGQIRYSVPEEMKQGAFVANIAVDLGLNLRQLSARKFRLSSDDGGRYMKVSLDNGLMSIRERIDREIICGQTDKCIIPFETILANPLEVYHGELEILDVNDNSPTFPQSNIFLQISEASAFGVRFRLEGADDPDIGTNTVAAYTISSSEHFSLITQKAEDGILIAELQLEKLLDREMQSSFQLLLTGIDGGTPQRSATVRILITVLDINDNPPVFVHDIYRGSVSENASRGTLVLKIQANDLDEGLNAELTYRFNDATLRRVRNVFNLDPRTGEILVKGPLDFEAVNSYSLDIQAQDHGSPAMTGHCKVLIKVIDVNDNAPEIKVTSASNKIQENTPPASFISLIYVIDRDSGANGQVRCELQKNVPFQLKKISNHYKLVTSEKLDREAISEYNILILAWDLGSPSQSTNRTVQIAISDVNDNAPQFAGTSYNVFVMENNAAGASIFTVTAMDPDLDQNSNVSYSLLDNHIQNLPVTTYLTINSMNGTIYALRSFDHEELKNFHIHVRARDAGVPPLSSSATVNVIILDQNDNAPVIVSPSEQIGSANVEVVPQTAGQGYLVTKIMATDADSGQNARLFYQMMKSTDPGLYSIGQHSGDVRTARNILQSDTAIQTLVILIKDNGQPSLSSTVTVNIRVLENSTEGISESSTLVKSPKYFSDPNVYLIAFFSCTSVIFLLIIILLIGIKCKQDRNIIQEYTSPSFSYNYGGSHRTFNGRPVLEETLRYSGTGRVVRVQEPNQYTVCLSPESAKSDFLFLEPCGPSTAQAECTANTPSNQEGIGSQHLRPPGWNKNEQLLREVTMTYAICFRCTSVVFLLIIILLIVIKCKQDRNIIREYYSLVIVTIVGFNARPAIEETFRYPGTGWIVRGPELNQYSVCLSPESAKSDFLFLKPRAPTSQAHAKLHWRGPVLDFGRARNNGVPTEVYPHIVCVHICICAPGLISGQIRYSIPEEMDEGAFVGNIAVDLGLNIPQLSARKFQLSSDEGERYMKVSLDNGVMSIREKIDRERICGQNDKCIVHFQTILEKPLEVYHGELEILDVNDNSPIFPQSSIALQISEASAPGVRFRLAGADDPDTGANTVVAYTISSSDHFSLRTQKTEDGTLIAELLLEKSLDREQQSSFQLLLTATDGGTPRRSATAQILITVLDINDNPPVFDHDIYRGSVSENAPRGTLLLKVKANDLDEGLNSELTYSFSDIALISARKLFSLDPDTGELRVKGPLDFEQVNSYSLDIRAQDHGSPAMTGHSNVLIKVIDVNDNAPEIKVTSSCNKIPENEPPGSFICLINVVDRDSGANGQVRCELKQKNVPFRLQKSSNNYKLTTSETLDREAISEYKILISAWDLGSPSLSSNKTIQIAISDVNDNKPQFAESSYNIYIMENNAPGASVSTVTATDPDLDQNSYVSYSFLDNHIQSTPVFTYLTINSMNGAIYALRSFDYEELKNFQIHVQARDAGVPPLSSSATVNVIILDQNDNAPVIVSPSQQSGSVAVDTVPRSAGEGYLVSKIMATDADSGQNAQLFYQIMKCSDPGLYNVGQRSGEIRTARNIFQSDTAVHTLVILVRDNGQPSLSSTVTMNIRVLENSTEGISESSTLVKNPEYLSDPNVYLIVIFSCTSVVFLLVIILLIGIKCKQDRNIIQEYNSHSYCYNGGVSHSTFNGISAMEETLRYSGAGQVVRGAEPSQYSICLSPESAKSDFLFLKRCGAPISQDQC